jgi:hypothetical protein
VGALKNLLHSQNLALSDYFSFFLFVMLKFVIKLDDFSHDRPDKIERVDKITRTFEMD